MEAQPREASSLLRGQRFREPRITRIARIWNAEAGSDRFRTLYRR